MSDYFIFDDIDTRNFDGIYVYFDEVDFTPKRVGEFIAIPSRNGEFFLDGGRYEDVTHTYDIIALNKETGRDLINAVASKAGHHRLEDSFNPTEFYSAVFSAEVDPTITPERDKFTFKLMFTRKPQRFLKSGEDALTVTNGQTITNPTLFDASPLLEVTGYGNINLNDNVITINNIAIGEVQVLPRTSKLISSDSTTATFTIPAFDDTLLNSGDAVTLSGVKVEAWVNETKTGYTLQSASVTSTTNADGICGEKGKRYTLQMPSISFVYGTSGTYTASMTCTVTWKHSGSTSSGTASLAAQIDYDGSNGVTVITTFTPVTPLKEYYYRRLTIEEIIGNSSTPAIADRVTYIDLDIGEAWGEIDGAIVSMNNAVQLPAELPALVSGENNILFDNTVTLLTITPRWWKV